MAESVAPTMLFLAAAEAAVAQIMVLLARKAVAPTLFLFVYLFSYVVYVVAFLFHILQCLLYCVFSFLFL